MINGKWHPVPVTFVCWEVNPDNPVPAELAFLVTRHGEKGALVKGGFVDNGHVVVKCAGMNAPLVFTAQQFEYLFKQGEKEVK